MNKILNQLINLTLIAVAIHESSYSDDLDISKIAGNMLFVSLLLLFAANAKGLNQENESTEQIVNEKAVKPLTKHLCQIYNRNFIALLGFVGMLAGLIFDQEEDINSKYYRIFTYDIPFIMTLISQLSQLTSDMLCDQNYDILRKTTPLSNITRLNYCRYLGTQYQIALDKTPGHFALTTSMAGISLDIGALLYKFWTRKVKLPSIKESNKILAHADKLVGYKANNTMAGYKALEEVEIKSSLELSNIQIKNEKPKSNLTNVSIFKQHSKKIEEIELTEEKPYIEKYLNHKAEEKAEILITAGNANAKI